MTANERKKQQRQSIGHRRSNSNSNEIATMATATTTGSPAPTAEAEPDECVLCCYPLPLKLKESIYKSCCGEVICQGCVIAQKRTLVIGTDVKKPIKGSKEEEREFMMMILSKQSFPCPFCRTEQPTNVKELLERLNKRIREYKDLDAMNYVGCSYMDEKHGLPKDLKKAEEVFKQAYDLGDPTAASNLVILYSKHIPDEARMIQYDKEGVRRGHAGCMVRLADHLMANTSDSLEEATQLFMMAARSGNDSAMDAVMNFCYPNEFISKDDLVTTLRAHKAATDKVKSESREYAERYTKFHDTARIAAKKKTELEKARDLIKNKKKKKKKNKKRRS